MARIFSTLRRAFVAILRSEQLLAEIRAGIANLGRMEPLLSEIRDRMTQSRHIQDSPGSDASDAFEILPIQDIPCPIVSTIGQQSLIGLMNDQTFLRCVEFFSKSPSATQSLVSPHFQALMYTLVRNTRPRDVFEIGTYRAATSEAICRALHANGAGLLHTADPYGAEIVPAILSSWPPELARHARFYTADSMLFFERMKRLSIEPYIVFIDGNHDYEFAAFDIEAAAQQISPGGWILVDNIAQPGPFLAARDFLARNPDWNDEAMIADKPADPPYDVHRPTIINTDCAILRRPSARMIRPGRPRTAGQQSWTNSFVAGIQVPLSAPATGTLRAQCILRSFGKALVEKIATEQVTLQQASGAQLATFNPPLEVPSASNYTVEIWLTWDGEAPLRLSGNPSAFE
jgi:predicted O-methyltransferase YrrM